MNNFSKGMITVFASCILMTYSCAQRDQIETVADKPRSLELDKCALISAQIESLDRNLRTLRKSYHNVNVHNDDPQEWVSAYTICIQTAKVKIVELNLSGFFASDDAERKLISDKVEQWRSALAWMVENRNKYRELEIESKHVLRNEANLNMLREKLMKALAWNGLEESSRPNSASDQSISELGGGSGAALSFERKADAPPAHSEPPTPTP